MAATVVMCFDKLQLSIVTECYSTADKGSSIHQEPQADLPPQQDAHQWELHLHVHRKKQNYTKARDSNS